MKLLFIISSLRPGGAERQLVELVRGLRKNDHKITVVTTKSVHPGYQETLIKEGIEVLCYERQYKYDLWPLYRIVRLVRSRDIDVMHSFLMLASFFGLIVSVITRKPLVASALRTTRPAGNLEVFLGKLLAGGADYLVSNSRAAFDVRFQKWKDNFAVIYNGMDFSRFDPTEGELETLMPSIDYRQDYKYVAMVASLSAKKDQETLLAAAKVVIEENPKVRLVLVGEDVEGKEARMRVLAQELGIGDNVTFAGYSSQSDHMMFLFDVVVLLTHPDFLEGCPNALLEAMAVGKPVLASAGGGTSEVIVDGETGLLVPAGDPLSTAEKLLKLLNDKSFSASLAARGRIYVRENFSISAYVANYERLYSTVTNKYRPHRKINKGEA